MAIQVSSPISSSTLRIADLFSAIADATEWPSSRWNSLQATLASAGPHPERLTLGELFAAIQVAHEVSSEAEAYVEPPSSLHRRRDLDSRLISEADFDYLVTAQRASNLLAALTSTSCERLGISVEEIAAVADLVQDNLNSVLRRTE